MGLISTADSTINAVALAQQSADPALIATRWQIYAKSGGLYLEDLSGVVSKVSTGSGGVDWGLTSTATAAGTTTLTVASNPIQLFTGATTQNCVLPDATTLAVGWIFIIRNTSSGIVTVKDGGAGATIIALAANQEVTLYCTSIGSAAGTWSKQVVTGSGAYVLATSPTIVTPTIAKLANLTSNGMVQTSGGDGTLSIVGVLGAGRVMLNTVTSTVTAAGTTTLTSASSPTQLFTGATTQICALPDATTLALAWSFLIRNTSSGAVTVNDGGGSLVVTLAASQEALLICTNIGSAAGAWSLQSVTGTGARVNATSPTLVTPVLGVAQATSVATSGHMAVNTTLSTVSALAVVETTADPAAGVQGIAVTETATLSAGNSLTPIVQAATFTATLNQGAFNATGAAPGGVRAFNAVTQITGAGGTVTYAVGFRTQITISGGGVLTSGAAVLIATPTNSSSTMTSLAGIAIAAQTTATNSTYLLMGTTTVPTGNFALYSPISTPSSHLGNFGIGLAANVLPTNSLSLTGQSAQIAWMERHTTANTAGNNLTVQSGGATSGATNKSAGSLILSSGVSTGSGTGDVIIQGSPGTAGSTSDNTLAEYLRVKGTGALVVPSTITTPGTTGNQTISKTTGRVNIAAAGTTVTVTSTLCTTSSIVIAVAVTADATARVTSVVPGAGSFTINTVACTGETAFSFLIIN